MVVIDTSKYLTGNSPHEIYFYKIDTSLLRASFIVDRGLKIRQRRRPTSMKRWLKNRLRFLSGPVT